MEIKIKSLRVTKNKVRCYGMWLYPFMVWALPVGKEKIAKNWVLLKSFQNLRKTEVDGLEAVEAFLNEIKKTWSVNI